MVRRPRLTVELPCKQLSLSIAPRMQGLCGVSGSPQSARTREGAGDARVPAEEGWTARLRRGRTAASPLYPCLNSVCLSACSALAGLERLQADFCRSLAGVSAGPSALPEGLL